jgi:hypothetical protein
MLLRLGTVVSAIGADIDYEILMTGTALRRVAWLSNQ